MQRESIASRQEVNCDRLEQETKGGACTMVEIGPYSNYRLTVRLELANKPGVFARVAALLAEEQANLGAVDIVSATKTRMVRDVTFDAQSEAHGEKVLARLAALPDVAVLSASDRIFLLHLGGKIRM